MISDLRLQQFRSYTDTSFNFGDGVNIIVGPNGSGKTNLLEAILVVVHGGSYRVSDAELLQFGMSWFRLGVGRRTLLVGEGGFCCRLAYPKGRGWKTRCPPKCPGR